MPDDLRFPVGPFRSAQHHINALCVALAYAATDPDGGAFVRAFLQTVEARRLLQAAAQSVHERLQ